MRRCRFCGGKIQAGIDQCPHCKKSLTKNKAATDAGSGLTNQRSWQGKSVPSWVMALVVFICLLCVWAMLASGCRNNQGNPDETGWTDPSVPVESSGPDGSTATLTQEHG